VWQAFPETSIVARPTATWGMRTMPESLVYTARVVPDAWKQKTTGWRWAGLRL